MNKILQKIAIGVSAVAVAASAYVIPAMAQTGTPTPTGTTEVVTPTNTQGWVTQDTNAGGHVNYIYDNTSPAPTGALQLLTDTTTTAKAQYMHSTNTALAGVTQLSYDTKQVSAPFAGADPSYQIPVCLTGVTTTGCALDSSSPAKSSFTTLVFEPYQNGTVNPNTWQSWDVASGLFWSSRTVTCGSTTINGTAGGPATYTLAAIKAACPNAVVVGFGVNIGSNNPSYNVETDNINFNGTTYNFEVTGTTVTPTPSVRPPTDKDACKNDGYKNLTDSSGHAFKNQGDCVSSTNH